MAGINRTTGKATDLITFSRASGGTALRKISYGSELVTNGGFNDASDWTLGTGWSISGGVATFNSGSGGDLIQTGFNFEAGKTYRITVDMTQRTGGGFRFVVDTGGSIVSGYYTTTATHTFSFTATQTATRLRLGALGGADFDVDNISVKEVLFDQPDGTLTLFNHPTNIPRIEYDAAGNVKGLLIEEARTNLLTYSEDFTQWTNSNSSDAPAFSVSAPDGTESATHFVPNQGSPASTPSVYVLASQTIEVRTHSCFMKAAEYTKGFIRIGGNDVSDDSPTAIFDLSAGEVLESQGIGVSAKIQSFSNGWYLCSLTYNNGSPAAGTGRAYAPNVGCVSDSYTLNSQTVTTNTDGTSGIYIWGAQLEAGSFPTSYISTSGIAKTRSADIASIPVSDFGYNQKAGTVVVQFDTLDTTLAIPFKIEDTGGSTTLLRGLASSGTALVQVFNGGVSQASLNAGALSSGQSYKLSTSFKENDFAASLDGGSVVTDTSGTLPKTMDVLALTQNNVELNGHIKSIQYYPRRLSDAQLESLTKPAATTTLSLTFDGLDGSSLTTGLHA